MINFHPIRNLADVESYFQEDETQGSISNAVRRLLDHYDYRVTVTPGAAAEALKHMIYFKSSAYGLSIQDTEAMVLRDLNRELSLDFTKWQDHDQLPWGKVYMEWDVGLVCKEGKTYHFIQKHTEPHLAGCLTPVKSSTSARDVICMIWERLE